LNERNFQKILHLFPPLYFEAANRRIKKIFLCRKTPQAAALGQKRPLIQRKRKNGVFVGLLKFRARLAFLHRLADVCPGSLSNMKCARAERRPATPLLPTFSFP
jgi:hypothetical protein